MSESISVLQASRLGKAFPQYIYALLAAGKLTGQKDDNGRWQISLSSFQEWLEARNKRVRK